MDSDSRANPLSLAFVEVSGSRSRSLDQKWLTGCMRVVPVADSKVTRERDVSKDLALRSGIISRLLSCGFLRMKAGRWETCHWERLRISSSSSHITWEELLVRKRRWKREKISDLRFLTCLVFVTRRGGTTSSSLEFFQASSKAVSGKSEKCMKA